MCNIIIFFIHMLCVKRIPIKIQCTRQYTSCIQIRIQNKISRIPTRIFCLKYWKHVKIGCKCSMVQVTTYRNNVSHVFDNIFYRWFSLGWQGVKQYHDIYKYPFLHASAEGDTVSCPGVSNFFKTGIFPNPRHCSANTSSSSSFVIGCGTVKRRIHYQF